MVTTQITRRYFPRLLSLSPFLFPTAYFFLATFLVDCFPLPWFPLLDIPSFLPTTFDLNPHPLPDHSLRAFSDGRGRKVLENLSFQNDERIAALELSLQEAQMIAEDSDKKYDSPWNLFHFSIIWLYSVSLYLIIKNGDILTTLPSFLSFFCVLKPISQFLFSLPS